jgi:hypothetical protein
MSEKTNLICARGHFYKGENLDDKCPECGMFPHYDLDDAIQEADERFPDFNSDEDKFSITKLF